MSETNQPKLLVLYADDDPDDIEYVTESLNEHAGAIELVAFPDAVSLLECIRAGQMDTLPCLIILDINMPRLNGKEALKIVRSIDGYETVPVVLFSTSSSPHDACFARQLEAEFLTKPLNDYQMKLIANKFLERCRESAKR